MEERKDLAQIVGRNIKKIRVEKGYKSQDVLAQSICVHLKSVQSWESGKRLPDLDALNRLCDVLQVDLDYLTGRIDHHTHANAVICESTGLSENAVELLLSRRQDADLLSSMLMHPDWPKFMKYLQDLSNKDAINSALADFTTSHFKRKLSGEDAISVIPLEDALLHSASLTINKIMTDATNTDL